MDEAVKSSLAWIEMHPALSGWVQALGALVAIAVAIVVPYLQRRLERRDEGVDQERQAIGLALLIDGELRVLLGQLLRARDDGNLRRKIVGPPSLIAQNVEKLWMLKDAGGYLLQLVGMLSAHARLSTETAEQIELVGNSEDLSEARILFNQRIDIAISACRDSIKEIEALIATK